jgi:hemerythrin
MILFTWYKKYSVDNEELDEHHKALFNIINKLYENCMYIANRHELAPIMDELILYSNYHFTAEEQHMINIGYKEIEKHISEHISFKQRALQLEQDIDKNDYEGSKELIAFLGNWLLHHVMEEDKKYSA